MLSECGRFVEHTAIYTLMLRRTGLQRPPSGLKIAGAAGFNLSVLILGHRVRDSYRGVCGSRAPNWVCTPPACLPNGSAAPFAFLPRVLEGLVALAWAPPGRPGCQLWLNLSGQVDRLLLQPDQYPPRSLGKRAFEGCPREHVETRALPGWPTVSGAARPASGSNLASVLRAVHRHRLRRRYWKTGRPVRRLVGWAPPPLSCQRTTAVTMPRAVPGEQAGGEHAAFRFAIALSLQSRREGCPWDCGPSPPSWVCRGGRSEDISCTYGGFHSP